MSSKNATVSALEKGPNPSKPEREQGYSALAKYMAASTADNSTLIFRRFDQLNARNLLVLESQISSHEARLASLEKELESKPVSAEWLKEWDVLCQQAQIDDDEVKSASRECAKEIVDLSRELEGLLGKYCTFRYHLFPEFATFSKCIPACKD